MEDVHGYLLMFVIVAFTIAISTLFLVGYKPKELNNKFDITFMSGVNAIFDNCKWIRNISDLTQNKGLSLIFGPFNDSNLDVIVGIRESGTDVIQSGWNTLSIKTQANTRNR